MNSVISVKNLGKRYQISHEKAGYVALRDIISQAWLAPINWFSGKKTKTQDFWALKNVSFEVKKGEVLGIIGSNGAGKTTLLKVLSRITFPSEGEVRMNGNVSSLLEVGTGFHPELTGKENIYLNGAILGMSKEQIDKNFQEIVNFAGVEAFLDTPVKRYSSGMQVRLAFAVAAHLDPDILIIDEVLAVGDAAFQKKSLGKMQEVTKQEGRTILFVSHNMDAIAKLCDRCILLEKGKIVASGKPEEIISEYLNNHQKSSAEVNYSVNNNKDIQIRSVKVFDSLSKLNTRLETGKPFSIEVKYDLKKEAKNVYAGIGFINLVNSNLLLNTLDIDSNQEKYIKREKGTYTSKFEFKENPFNVGKFRLFVHIGEYPPSNKTLDKKDDDITITFLEGETFITNTLNGKRNSGLLLKIPSQVIKNQ